MLNDVRMSIKRHMYASEVHQVAYLFYPIVKLDKGLLEVKDVRILCFLGHWTEFGQKVLQPFPASASGLLFGCVWGIRVRLLVLGLRPDAAAAPSRAVCSTSLPRLCWKGVCGTELPDRPTLMKY